MSSAQPHKAPRAADIACSSDTRIATELQVARSASPCDGSVATVEPMAEKPKLVTAAEMDAMTPDERAQLVRSRIITSLDDLPEGFRQDVVDEARRLSKELRAASSE